MSNCIYGIYGYRILKASYPVWSAECRSVSTMVRRLWVSWFFFLFSSILFVIQYLNCCIY